MCLSGTAFLTIPMLITNICFLYSISYFLLCCAVLCLVIQSCLTLCNPMDCSPPGSSVHEDSPGKNTRVGCCGPPPGDLPNLGVEPRSPTLKADSLPFEPPEKPKNTGRGSLSLLQGIFPNQECNWVCLHCRRILHQLSSQGFPTTYNGYAYAYIKASLIL